VTGPSAGIARRLAALIYDALLIAGLLMVFTGVVLFSTHGSAVLSETVGSWVYLYRAGLVAVVATYFIGNWMLSGQTLGMRAWHLYALDARGGRLGFVPALLRFVLAVAAWLPAGIGVLWLYVDPERLALHDRLAKTRLVVSTRPRNRGDRTGADHERG
jgi:uncharacterized RDD family membrane protein YckC